MACNASKMPFIRAISTRSFASAQTNPSPSAPAKQGLATCVMRNKMIVSSVDNGSAVSRVTVAYKAGSRYEGPDQAGVSHLLRAAAGNTTSGASIFAITRKLQQYGANLSATVDREVISYTLEANKENLENAVEFLAEVASKQVFKPWEFDIIIPRVKYEIAGLAPQVRVMDLLHKAAFRRGLGNSLFCSPRQVGSIGSENLQYYVSQNFVSSRCAIAAVGLSQERTVAIANTLSLQECEVPPTPATEFKSGELRKEMGGPFALVTLAAQGAGLCNLKESLILAIVAKAMSSGPQVKWGADNAPLGKALASQLSNTPFAARAFNISYSDNGLFGVCVSVPKNEAGKAVQTAFRQLRGAGNLGQDALNRGRTQLMADILYAGDTPSQMVDDLAISGLLTGHVYSSADMAAEVCKITDSEINMVAGRVAGSKLSMAAVGNIANVPYLDELK